MTRKFIILLTVMTTFLQVGQTQINLKYGAELGISVSQFPLRKSYSNQDGNKYITWTHSPLFGPLIGLTAETTIKKYLQFTSGLQYQVTGHKFYEHRDSYDMLAGANYKTDNWESQTFHKLCLPLSFGLTFRLWTLQPSIFIGDRPNFFIKGRYYSKFVIDHDINTEDKTTEAEFNPLNNDRLEAPVRHFNNQFFCGFSTAIGQYVKISLTINSGKQIYYSESAFTCLPYFFDNNDYLATLQYYFGTSKKNNNADNK